MTEEKRVFYWGIFLMIISLMLAVVLQQLNRNQKKSLNKVGDEITRTKQQIAQEQTIFASHDTLENLLVTVYPDAEVVGFKNSVSIYELEPRK